ncbi:MAG: LAGLIDADG family homing endonuclease [Nanoarchaeota archaeon]
MFDIIIGRSESDKKKFGSTGTILLGKHYVKMGRTTSLSNLVYLDMLRSHVIFVCGKRGGGKCLTGDTLITLSDGSQIPIEQLENTDKDLISLDETLKLATAVKSDFYKRTVDRILEITLRTGKKIKLTPEHPLLTLTGWVPAKEIPLGGRIATPRKSNFGEKSRPEQEIKLLAYLIAEGHLGNGFVIFSNSDQKIVSDFKEAVFNFDKGLCIKVHGKDQYRIVKGKKKGRSEINRECTGRFGRGTHFVEEKSSLRLWLESLGLYPTDSYTKYIPDQIFTLPRAQLALFLNRLFSCDGTIYFDKNALTWRISYASSSETLIRQVQALLLKFGIISILRRKLIKGEKKNFRSFELELRGASVHSFLNEIGFFGTKEERQRKGLLSTCKRNPNLDTIPADIWNIYRPKSWADIGREMNYSHPKALRSSISYSPSREKLRQIALVDQRDDILQIADSDIYWDEIVDVKLLSGEFKVYDITVPEHHNFIANDIIVHNSYTMGVIAEGMTDLPSEVRNNLSIIMLDTMGIYWTMKFPNKKDRDLLKEWGLEPKGMDVVIYCPEGYFKKAKEEGIPVDFPFSVRTSELTPEDWCLTFGMEMNDPFGVLIERVILDLQEVGKPYHFDEIIAQIESDTDSGKEVRDAVKNRFLSAQHWGIFSKEGTPLSELAKPGQVTVLDVSIYATQTGGWNIKSLVIGLVAEKLFIERMKERKVEEFNDVHKAMNYFGEDEPTKDYPLVWLVIDEAHEFLPVAGKTSATDALVTILREGRQPGISLVLASQQPGKIHTDVMTQADTIISHRITAKIDTDALGMLMQSYMRTGLDKFLDDLPRENGAAIVLDDSNERMYPIRVRPRMTWHGGESPTAFGEKKELL